MSATGIVISLLKGSAVNAAVSGRIFAVTAPQGAPRPYITVRLVSEFDGPLLQGAGGYPESRVEVAIVADNADTANALGETIKGLLHTITSVSVGGFDAQVMKAGASDFMDSDDSRSVFRRLTDYLVRYR